MLIGIFFSGPNHLASRLTNLKRGSFLERGVLSTPTIPIRPVAHSEVKLKRLVLRSLLLQRSGVHWYT